MGEQICNFYTKMLPAPCVPEAESIFDSWAGAYDPAINDKIIYKQP